MDTSPRSLKTLQRFIPGHDQSYRLARWLFLRLLGVVYCVAFFSLGTQIVGLVGHNGILPADEYLGRMANFPAASRYRLLPTVFWLNSSDAALQMVAFGGAALAVLLILDIAPVPVLALLWVGYLSLSTVGQDFLGFQWDALLIEVGFLAIFLAPPHLRPRLPRTEPPRLVLWLCWWLLFRLMFSSGVVKLLSGDPTWANLTALTYHYETQPLPTPIAWYVHQLPLWFHQLSTLGVFVVELFVPFLIFIPMRRLRLIAAALLIFLQLLIALTGNYAFFNLLTVALCVLLLDDTCLRRVLPKRLTAAPVSPRRSRPWLALPLVMLILVPGLTRLAALLVPANAIPPPARDFTRWLAPLEIVNSYGLFAVMTTTRPEIIVEGSNDGQIWTAYEFRYKLGSLQRPPPWIEPFQPRLDWQMWFAALGSYEQNPWVANFLNRLLQGSPDVLTLLDTNPFPDAPPRYVRAVLYDYHFTDAALRSLDGAWWQRTKLGDYSPVLSGG